MLCCGICCYVGFVCVYVPGGLLAFVFSLKCRSDQGPYVRLTALDDTHMPLMDSQSCKKWTLMMEIKSHSPPDLSILD